ncbi:Triose-phosphate Transporter [Lunasporangiospora selenospora]|uniref:Triose-phosphate Transporter n=1 Tax=Lunasporangiospora selenospora TaxID=979761 RepID=A0A9P6FWD7_9FUNG|nr:Triose-phosphate Transporter [Lunasporangiospora selenospora]
MLASVLGGLRWSLTQLLLERSDAKSGSLANPISTILFLSPIMGVCLAIVAGIFEGYGTIFESTFFATLESTMTTLGLLLFGGVIAFAMVLAEFNLIARTSVVTLSVLGIVKEIVTIVISSFVFHDKLTIVNTLGLFVTLSGIGLYHYMKMTEMKAKTQKAAEELSLHGIASRSSDESESSALNPLSPPMDERRLKKKKRREGEKSPKKEVEEQSGGGRPAVMVDEVSWDEAPLLQSGGQQDRQDLKKQRDLSDTEPFVLEEPPTHSKQ